MLTSLRKQAWFVFLMVFAIGWSTAALASEQLMHEQMMHSSAVEHLQTASKDMPDCHDSLSVHSQIQHHPVEQLKVQHDQDCHQGMADHQQHFSCNDCLQLHCQSLTLWLDSQAHPLVHLQAIPEHQQLNFYYSAKHLSGFWQQILRPPKA